ncbi:MAG: hypothetical protein IT427_19120 [Pirellulales bacterium]|nr:hypothetical protein [Pirellulales bacterium]
MEQELDQHDLDRRFAVLAGFLFIFAQSKMLRLMARAWGLHNSLVCLDFYKNFCGGNEGIGKERFSRAP